MIREIKTTLAIDGEKKFKEALASANREMRVMNADLRAMAAEFSATNDAQRFYAQRSETLNQKVRQQDEIVQALTRAVGESAAKYGDAASQTDEYRIKLSSATAQLFKMRQEAEEANRELEELGRDSNKIGRQIENGIGDAAEETAEKLDGMFERVSADIAEIRSNSTFGFFSNAVDFGAGIVSGLADFTESTRDYRRSLSFLERNAETYNLDFTAVKELLFEMASVSGEIDSSVEALSNLMAAGFDAQELAAAVDLLGGAVVRFPDTLKFESLADGLQETLATGTAAGQYAELLERLGVDLEEFNKDLENVKTAEEKQQIALAYLTKYGLATAYSAYKETAKELLAAEEATLKWNDALATLGATVEPFTTWATNFGAAQVEDFAKFLVRGVEATKTGDFLKIFGGAGETEVPDESRWENAGPEEKKALEEKVTDALEAYGWTADDLKAHREKAEAQKEYKQLGKELGSLADIAARTPEENAKIIEKYGLAADEVAELVDNLAEVFDYVDGEKTMDDFWDRYKPEAQNESNEPPKHWWETIFPSAGAEELSSADLQSNFEDKGSMAWTAFNEGVLAAAEENPAMKAILDQQLAEMEAENAAAATAGRNAMISLANGIAEGGSAAISNTAQVVNQINALLASLAVPGLGMAMAGITGGSILLGSDDLTSTVSKRLKNGVKIKDYIK